MSVIKWLNKNIEKFLSSVLFMAFTALMCVNVIMLLISNEALAWASEAVMLLFVQFVWISISYAFKERKHINVTFVVDLIPKQYKFIFESIVSLFIITFFVSITYYSIEWIQNPAVQNKTSLLLQYPMWLYYISAPIGATLSILRLVQNLIEDIKNNKNNNNNNTVQQ